MEKFYLFFVYIFVHSLAATPLPSDHREPFGRQMPAKQGQSNDFGLYERLIVVDALRNLIGIYRVIGLAPLSLIR